MFERLHFYARVYALWLFFCPALVLYVLFHQGMWSRARPTPDEDMRFYLPAFVQLGLAGGDRFLAANLGAIRSQVALSDEMSEDSLDILARLQLDVSILNPRHEDNYYTAAAILPWHNQLSRAQAILWRAGQSRPTDTLPFFLHAFNRMYFQKDHLGAASDLQIAAQRAVGGEKINLMAMAGTWAEKSINTDHAIKMLTAMANASADPRLKRTLEARASRLRSLIFLRGAVEQYRLRFGRAPVSLEQLVSSGIIQEIPKDPFKKGFSIENGQPIILKKR